MAWQKQDPRSAVTLLNVNGIFEVGDVGQMMVDTKFSVPRKHAPFKHRQAFSRHKSIGTALPMIPFDFILNNQL